MRNQREKYKTKTKAHKTLLSYRKQQLKSKERINQIIKPIRRLTHSFNEVGKMASKLANDMHYIGILLNRLSA